jgi:ketosteroid isomerase-like protein
MRWLGALLLVAACGGAQKPPAQRDCRDRALEESLIAADRAGPTNVTDDVIILIPLEPFTIGRDAVKRRFSIMPEGKRTRIAVRAEVHGDLGYVVGLLERELTETSGTDRFVKYLNVWRREGGVWRVEAQFVTRPVDTPTIAPALELFTDKACVAPIPRDQAKAAVMAADVAFDQQSAADGVAAAFGAWATDDAILVGKLAVGREAIVAEFAGSPDDTLRWKPLKGGASSDGALGWTVGEGTYTSGTQQFFSKYITIWRREADGSWKFVADGGNPRPAP